MADKIRILYFLEDIAQEGFITSLVKRVASEESIVPNSIDHDIRSARGGSKVLTEFKNFIKDTKRIGTTDINLLVVAIDGNCKGHRDRIIQLEKYVKSNHPLKGSIVYAVPDPHIERWYLMDQRALKDGVGLDRAPNMPPNKCERAYYKQVLNQALKESDVSSLLGGAEYAERIVSSIVDIKSLYDQNAGFQVFVEDLRRMLRSKLQ